MHLDRGATHALVLEAKRRVDLAALPAGIELVLARNLPLVTASVLVGVAAVVTGFTAVSPALP